MMLFCSIQLIGLHEIVTDVRFTEVFLILLGEPVGSVYCKIKSFGHAKCHKFHLPEEFVVMFVREELFPTSLNAVITIE